MDSIKHSSREHPQTVQKPRNGKFLGLHGKLNESEYFNGTPDTQPETPDIFGLHSVDSKHAGRENDEHLIPLATCDENHFFSPMGRVAMNLNEDYDAESLGEGLHSSEAKETPESNQKSSKRRMFEALMAIAKSPVEKKKENTFNSKKDLMSALRGFAHTPEKKCDDSSEVINSKLGGALSCSVEASNEAVTPYKTPAKETCTSGIDILIQASPAKQELDINKSVENSDDIIKLSPEAKEIAHLNTALESLKNKLYDDFDDSDSRVGSNALENYKAAVEKFRCMELQQKKNHGTRMLCSKSSTQSTGIDVMDGSPAQNEIEKELSMMGAPEVEENSDAMHTKQDISDSVPTKFAPHTLKLVESITQVDPRKHIDTGIISPEKGDKDEKKNESFGSTDASPGIKTPSLREKFMLMGALLPDISPSKSEVVSVCGAESVASTVVTQKMSVVHASYLVASDYVDKIVADPTIKSSTSYPSHICDRNNETKLQEGDLSPNLLDKANISCEEDPLTPNLLDKANGSSPSQPEDNLSEPVEDPPTPNLLDKAKDTPIRAQNSEAREIAITPNMFDKAESLHQRLQAVGTPNKSPDAYNDIPDISYLPRQYGDTQDNRKDTNRLQTSTQEKDELHEVLDNVIKLNLGPTLTNEIMRSVKKCSRDLGAPSLGINQIDIDVDYDDHSEVSSLGTGSILSNVALSTLNALARKNPKEPIENIIRDFNRMQKMQNSTNFPAVDSLQYSPDTAHSPPIESAFPSNPIFRIQPPRVDTKKGRDKRRYDMIYKQEKRFIPSIENGVLNDFEKLQKEVEHKSQQKITDQISALKVEKKQDFQHNQYLMNEFEKIENRDCRRQWATSKNSTFGTEIATRQKSNDEWLVNFEEPCDEKIEPLKGLLKNEKEEVDDAIEQKKLMYENIENSVHSDMDDKEDREIKKKKKKKKVLKKMAKLIKRKKKTHDEEGSIGIASLSTMNTAEDGKGKKNRFKFLKSLRRKKKNAKDACSVCDSSVMFDDDNIEEVSESFIVDNIGVVENDEAEVSYYSDCSEETSLASKNSCAYATLET